VVYMGLANMGQISANLMAAGLPGATPVMAVSKATLPDQQTCKATLATLVDTINAKKLKSPVLIIIGQVAGLADIIGPEMMPKKGSDDDETIRSIARA